jgi:chromosome segregation ATPase
MSRYREPIEHLLDELQEQLDGLREHGSYAETLVKEHDEHCRLADDEDREQLPELPDEIRDACDDFGQASGAVLRRLRSMADRLEEIEEEVAEAIEEEEER